MKLKSYESKKATKTDFLEKISFLWKQGQVVKFGLKLTSYNTSLSLLYSTVKPQGNKDKKKIPFS